MNQRTYRMLFALLLVAAAAIPAQARGHKSSTSTEPGKYKEWGPDIDELEIVKTFKFADYKQVVVEPFDTSSVALPDKDAGPYSLKISLQQSARR